MNEEWLLVEINLCKMERKSKCVDLNLSFYKNVDNENGFNKNHFNFVKYQMMNEN